MTNIWSKFPTKNKKGVLDLFLLAGILIFNVVSAYTTQLGVKLVFREGSVFLTSWIPWLFAIAISAFLMFFSLKIAFFSQQDESINRLAVAYLSIALVSIFLNFNAIYSSMTIQAVETENFVKSKRQTIDSLNESIEFLRRLKTKREIEISRKQAEMAFEENRSDNPGQGPKYQTIRREHDVLVGEYEIQKREIEQKIIDIKKLKTVVQALEGGETFEDTKLASDDVSRIYYENFSKMKVYENIKLKNPEVVLGKMTNRNSLEYSLGVIVDEIRSLFVPSSFDGDTFFRFLLSMIFSLMIDLLVFFGIVFSRPKIFSARDEVSKVQEAPEIWKRKLW